MNWPPYPAYRHSGVEWLGDIPSAWNTSRLKFIAWFNYGESLPAEAREAGEVAVYGSNGPVGTNSAANTSAPCIVIGRKGSFGSIQYTDSPCFAIDTTYFVDPSSAKADIRWLFYALSVLQLDALSRDSAVPGLSREFAHNQWLPYAPELEQRAIAAFLDRETATIDALIAKQQRLIELLQEKRAALISHAVTKGLDPTVPMKDSGVEWLGEIPAHWEVRRLKHVSESLQTGPFGSQLHTSDYWPGGIPVVNPSHLRDGCIQADPDVAVDERTRDRLIRHELRAGDIVLARRGELGRSALVTQCEQGWLCGTGSLRMRPRRDLVHSPFLNSFLSTKGVQDWLTLRSVGSTMDNLNTAILGRVPTTVPPVREQRAIAAFLDLEAAKIDALIAKVKEAIERLREYRTALISAAVTGKIDVRGDSESTESSA